MIIQVVVFVFSVFVAPDTFLAARIPSADVWEKAEQLGARNDIDPLLIYAIACAESSLNDRADSGHARGIMQMTDDAWADVTQKSYSEAWNWRTNMEMATCYLRLLKKRLEKSQHYSWPILVASYHFGIGTVERHGYNTARLPAVHNRIYRDMLKGITPKLPFPAPERSILLTAPAARPSITVTRSPTTFDIDQLPYLFDSPIDLPIPSLIRDPEDFSLPKLADPNPDTLTLPILDGPFELPTDEIKPTPEPQKQETGIIDFIIPPLDEDDEPLDELPVKGIIDDDEVPAEEPKSVQ